MTTGTATRLGRLAKAAAAVLTGACLALSATAAQAATCPATSSIWDDATLANDGSHIDNQGQYGVARLIMQTDGNLVTYYAPGGDFTREYATWASGTVGCGTKAVMRSDGDLVVLNASGGLCWESGTAGHPHARLTVWRNGDVLITDTCDMTLWQRQPGVSYVSGQSFGALATPDSTESPYIVLPPPTGC
ncbi:hypothetical protein [Kitasatospora viridis]|uniref:D-mannose binding lectin n=1 Tax=Kitasatospora viridis TaxID=281105 RepID=A0A561SE59_9ACTN|nr:hypothetical protein [Kitasatospora viridis]TWF73125.1 D-mannose binding lectin [Kitasatospora viridis]